MKLMTYVRGLKIFRFKKQIFLTIATTSLAIFIGIAAGSGSEKYVSASPAITQRFTGVMSEKMLLDFCYQVRALKGITGVSYRDFSPSQRTATVTVFYNPRVTTQRQIKIFLEHASVLWVVPKAT